MSQVAIVTGGSSGIGAAIALRLGQNGFKVGVNYAGKAAEAEQVAANVAAAGGDAVAIKADVSNSGEVRELFATVSSRFGPVDVLVNNAGRAIRKNIAEFEDAEFESVIKTNLFGTFYCMREAARTMNQGGRIVNISMSFQGAPIPGYGVYFASKAGVEQLTATTCKELGSRQITVNAVRPGPARTPLFLQGKSPELIKHFEEQSALGRLTEPTDIADVVEYLVSEKAGWITGQCFAANGGYW